MTATFRARYVYFDHSQWTWVCSEAFKPCSDEFSTARDALYNHSVHGDLIYKGAGKGSPAFDTIRGAAQTWTLENWGNQTHRDATAVFTC